MKVAKQKHRTINCKDYMGSHRYYWKFNRAYDTAEQYLFVRRLGLGYTVGLLRRDVTARSRGGGRRWCKQLLQVYKFFWRNAWRELSIGLTCLHHCIVIFQTFRTPLFRTQPFRTPGISNAHPNPNHTLTLTITPNPNTNTNPKPNPRYLILTLLINAGYETPSYEKVRVRKVWRPCSLAASLYRVY